MRCRSRGAAFAAAVAASLLLSGVVATAAFADPASCSGRKPSIGLDDYGRLSGEGYGYCNDSTLRYFTGEIKWDKSFAPDPLTATDTASGYQSYYIHVASCDNKNTRSYYMRTYWTSTPSAHHDSDHRVLRAC